MTRLKRKPRPRMRVREPSQIRCASHLQWVRGNVCLIHGKAHHVCEGRTEAHHVVGFFEGGVGLKAGDDKVVPLCTWAHKELHDRGQDTFERTYGVDLKKEAPRQWQASPARRRYEAKMSVSATGENDG